MDAARGKVGGGEGDGFGLVDLVGLCVSEPGGELGKWVGGKLMGGEGAFGVLFGLKGVVCTARGEDVFGVGGGGGGVV